MHHGPFDQRAGAWAGCARIGPLVQRHLSAPRRGSREDTTEVKVSLMPQPQLRQRPGDGTGRHARLRSEILGVRLSPGAPVFERTVFLDVAQPGQRSRLGSERSVVRIHPSRPSDWGGPSMVALRVLIPSVARSSPASLARFFASRWRNWQRSGLQSRWLRVRVLPGVPDFFNGYAAPAA